MFGCSSTSSAASASAQRGTLVVTAGSQDVANGSKESTSISVGVGVGVGMGSVGVGSVGVRSGLTSWAQHHSTPQMSTGGTGGTMLSPRHAVDISPLHPPSYANRRLQQLRGDDDVDAMHRFK